MPEPTAASPQRTAAAPAQRGAQTGSSWDETELAEVRAELEAQVTVLQRELQQAEDAVVAVQRSSSGEGSGDEADAGSKTFERAHEATLANNSRELLQQVERALERLADRTYGRCESCAQEIPKPRLQAFPRATLCVSCKQRQERR